MSPTLPKIPSTREVRALPGTPEPRFVGVWVQLGGAGGTGTPSGGAHKVGSRGGGFNAEVPCPHPAVPFPACHILECPEGLAQDVISTIGQAFELRFKQYLKNPPKLVTPHDR